MTWIERLAGWTSRFSAVLGAIAIVLCAITACLVVILRYVFNVGYAWMQEAYVWQHAIAFLLCAAYALHVDFHVRVDVLYGRWSDRTRAKIDIAGTLIFLWPWLAVLVAMSGWDFVAAAWRSREASVQPNGLPGLYLLKGAILVFAALLFIESLARVVACARVLAQSGEITKPGSNQK
jgi:TRAP-type mannitol/chloroaromatic compound transport system permease small subunit